MAQTEEFDLLMDYKLGKTNIGDIRKFFSTNFRNNSVDMKELLYSSRKFSIDNKLDELKAWSDYFLSFYYSDISDFVLADKYARETLDLFEKNDNLIGTAYAYNALSNCYSQMDNSELAYEMSLKGISIAKYFENEFIFEVLISNLVIMCLRNEKYKMARELMDYYELIKTRRHKDLGDMLISAKTNADLLNCENRPEEAMRRLNKFVDADYDLQYPIYMCEIYKIYAQSLALNHRLEESRQYFFKGIKMASDNGFEIELCENRIAYGKFEIEYADVDKGIEAILKSYKVAETKHYRRFIKQSTLILYKYYKSVGDVQNSLKCLKEFDQAVKNSNPDNMKELTARLNLSLRDETVNLEQILDNNLDSITEMGENICSSKNIEYILKEVKNEIKRLVNIEIVGLSLFNEDDYTIDHFFIGKANELKSSYSMKLDDSMIASYCIRTKKAVFSNDFESDEEKYRIGKKNVNGFDKFILRTAVYMPLILEDKVLAVFSIQSGRKNAFNAKYISMIKLIANYMSIAVKNAVEYEKLQRIAIYDNLTGFLTKSEILIEGEALLEEMGKKSSSTSIIMLDMDGLKRMNDTYGHMYGDETLRIVTEIINKTVRKDDLLGRYGGDEFLVILPNTTSQIAYKIIERIRKKIDELKLKLSNGVVEHVTISAGIFEKNPDVITSLEKSIDNADAALYLSKENGKNKTTLYIND